MSKSQGGASAPV